MAENVVNEVVATVAEPTTEVVEEVVKAAKDTNLNWVEAGLILAGSYAAGFMTKWFIDSFKAGKFKRFLRKKKRDVANAVDNAADKIEDVVEEITEK